MKTKIFSTCTDAVQPVVHFRSSGSLLSSNTVLYPYKPLSFVNFVVVFSLHSQEKVISFMYFPLFCRANNNFFFFFKDVASKN